MFISSSPTVLAERTAALTVRSGRGAAVGVVAEGVNVHTTLSVGVVAGDVPCDGGLRVLVGLLEGDGSLDVGVSTDNSDYKVWVSLALVQSRNPPSQPLRPAASVGVKEPSGYVGSDKLIGAGVPRTTLNGA